MLPNRLLAVDSRCATIAYREMFGVFSIVYHGKPAGTGVV